MYRNEVFDPSAVTGLSVKLAWAMLEILTADVGQIQVLISGADEDVEDLRVGVSKGVLTVEQPAYGLSARIASDRWLQVTLRVPATWKGEIAAGTVAGPLSVRGLAGTDLRFSTVSGSLRASQLNAITLTLRTITGVLSAADITASESFGARTVSGEILLSHVSAGRVKLTTVSAPLTADLDSVPEHTDISTVSGDVTMALPAREAVIRLRSVTGRLLTGGVSIAETGPEISAVSVSGGLTVNCKAVAGETEEA
ncbi:MAG: DUF4097 family beta strand repeat protein [Clostridia bacterium]|nr:DUF4097 family beta strand repeat protein [Clostridia bacterium]